MQEYINFVKIPAGKKESVLQLLDSKDVDHPNFFQSKTITPNCMVNEWHFFKGIVARLIDNVSKFNRYLANK
jgi:hypothetical protein